MGSGGGGTSTQYVKSETSNLPSYAAPYYSDLMTRSQANLSTPYIPYGYTQNETTGTVERAIDPTTGQPVANQRIADFTAQQKQVQQNVLNQQTPGQFGQGSQLAATAGIGALNASQYNPSQFNAQQIGQPNLQQYSMQQPNNVRPMMQGAPQMGTAQTGYNPSLDYFQMQGPQQFGSTQAQQYMSPYMQNVVDVQKNEAIRDAQKGQLAQNLGAARQGTYGGARQLLAGTERERNLGTQLGQIQAQGQQQAFQNAQQQFNTEQGLNQQAGQQNLSAALGVQQLGTQTGLQTSLANLSSAQQANVQNQAAQLQQQGLNQQQALQAALANQQAGLTTGQQNLNAALQTQQLGAQTGLSALQSNQQANLEAQKLAEQSRQFGSQQGLAGLAQANQSAQTLANLGSAQQQSDIAMYGQQQATAAQQQALDQSVMSQQYQDFLNQQNYYNNQLAQYSSLLHGVPVTPTQTSTVTSPAPSLASQIMGTGVGALGIAKTLGAI